MSSTWKVTFFFKFTKLSFNKAVWILVFCIILLVIKTNMFKFINSTELCIIFFNNIYKPSHVQFYF